MIQRTAGCCDGFTGGSCWFSGGKNTLDLMEGCIGAIGDCVAQVLRKLFHLNPEIGWCFSETNPLNVSFDNFWGQYPRSVR